MCRRVMSGGVMSLCQMRVRRPGVVQRMRGVQRPRAHGAGKKQSNRRYPRKLHSANILSPKRIVPYTNPQAVHVLLIGHSAAASNLSRRWQLLYSKPSGPECDSNHPHRPAIDYLHNNQKDGNAASMLRRAPKM
jgi:hypothetical protein